MARKVETIVTLTDDIDGGKADRTVSFSFDGREYEVDLSKKNANAFEKAITPYIDAGRKVRSASRGRRAGSAGSSATRKDLSVIREWAASNGFEVSARGRVAQQVQDAYDAAH